MIKDHILRSTKLYETSLTHEELRDHIKSFRYKWSMIPDSRPIRSIWREDHFMINNHGVRATGNVIAGPTLKVSVTYSLPKYAQIIWGTLLLVVIMVMWHQMLDHTTTINGKPSNVWERILLGAIMIAAFAAPMFIVYRANKPGLEKYLVQELKFVPFSKDAFEND